MLAALSYVMDRVVDDKSSVKSQDRKELIGGAVFSAAVLGVIYLVGILFWGMGRMNGSW